MLLAEGTLGDPLVVVRGSLWRFNAVGLFSNGEAVVIDPGVTPDEIELLADRVRHAHLTGAPRRVTHVLLTHSHHDHIRGWSRFEGAEVVMPRAAADKNEKARERILAAKNRIDRQLDVEDGDFSYPEAGTTFDDRVRITCGDLELEQIFLPGHSNCTSVVWIPALRTLCTSDYLVSPGLPYCRFAARPFEEALARMAGWVDELGIDRIVPAHRELIVGREDVRSALERDIEYMKVLREGVRASLTEGIEEARLVRRVAREMAEWRDEDVGGRDRQDRDNAQRVLAEETSD